MARIKQVKQMCRSCRGNGGYFAPHLPNGVPCMICRGRGYVGEGLWPDGVPGNRNYWAVKYDREAREREAAGDGA